MPTRNATADRSVRQTNLKGEVWKDVPRYTGYYQASSKGRVKSLPRVVPMCDGRKYTVAGKILTQKPQGQYMTVVLSQNGKETTELVHRLVLEAFVGSCPERMQCRHLNGDGTDNRADNLIWGTSEEQARDRERHGTTILGRKGATHKLTGFHDEILALWDSGWSMGRLARRYGVLICSISYIIRQKFKRRARHG